MSRVKRLQRADLPPEGQAVWDEIAGPNGTLRGAFHSLIRIPPLAQSLWHVGNHVRFASKLSEADRETAILTTVGACGATHEYALHVPRAQKAGVRLAVIDALESGGDIASLHPRERLLIEVSRSLLETHGIDDALYARAVAEFGEESLVDLVSLVGWYIVLSMLTGSFGVVEK